MLPEKTVTVEKTLAELDPGETGRVLGIEGSGVLAQRLIDMGLYPGVLAVMLRRAPFGDPIEVEAEGAYITLRKDEARFVKVKKSA
ncbi:MAG: ferrous iron transport protein A [Fretibacterium sp.]|nr:ferrous iron transport protein A [Fretibacterium sp.]